METSSFHIGVLPAQPVAEVAELAVEGERLGFGGIWVADSQSIFRDPFQALALAGDRTERILLATGVTNPITRHIAVLASSFATLAELSGGRAVLGIGVGESAVRTIGRKPARLAELEEATHALRALLRGEPARVDGTEIRQTWSGGTAPIFFAASGPRMLELAGRIADGVLFQVGAEPGLVRYALEHIEAGERATGRAPGSVTRIIRLGSSVAHDRARARDEARGYVAAAAGTVYWAVPRERLSDELYADLQRMKERYDYQRHASGDAEHAALITDRIIDAISISGTPDEAVPRFRELAALGVDGFNIPVRGDAHAALRVLTDDVIPHV
jgi:5,10-methylenetetrahydromethanopterin reductase